MNWRLSNLGCSTRVSRVQFGVPPNCGRTRGQTFGRTRYQSSHVSPVSGGTPETTRETRVLQKARSHFLRA